MLLQYPDGADCPLRVKQLKKSEKEWLHGRGCGCVGVGKKENDHVTSLIHPLGLMYAAGQRNGHSGSVQLFLGSSLQPLCSFPVIIPAWAASSVISVALFYLVISLKELVTGLLLQFLVRIWSLWFFFDFFVFIFFSLCACVWFINSCHFIAWITEAPVFPQLISRGFHQSYMAQPYQNRALQSGTSVSFKKWIFFFFQNTCRMFAHRKQWNTDVLSWGKKSNYFWFFYSHHTSTNIHTYIDLN